MKTIKIIAITTFITFIFLGFPSETYAHCPLCVAGAGMGVALSRYLGVDDVITGVWLGAFLGAISFWTNTILLRKKQIPFTKTIIYLLIFISTIWSFYQFGLVGKYSNDIYGYPKLVFGVVSGGMFFYLVDVINNLLVKRHGKVLFPYQRIVISLGSMLMLSLGVYVLASYSFF